MVTIGLSYFVGSYFIVPERCLSLDKLQAKQSICHFKGACFDGLKIKVRLDLFLFEIEAIGADLF